MNSELHGLGLLQHPPQKTTWADVVEPTAFIGKIYQVEGNVILICEAPFR